MPSSLDPDDVDRLVDRVICKTARLFRTRYSHCDPECVPLRVLLEDVLRDALMCFATDRSKDNQRFEHCEIAKLGSYKRPSRPRQSFEGEEQSTDTDANTSAQSMSSDNEGRDIGVHCPSRTQFMDLPAELRVMVYDLLLAGDSDVANHTIEIQDRPNPAKRPTHINILMTSRQVYDEALPSLYRDREFEMRVEFHNDSTSRLCRSLDTWWLITLQNIQHLTLMLSVRMLHVSSGDFICSHAFSRLPALKHLRVALAFEAFCHEPLDWDSLPELIASGTLAFTSLLELTISIVHAVPSECDITWAETNPLTMIWNGQTGNPIPIMSSFVPRKELVTLQFFLCGFCAWIRGGRMGPEHQRDLPGIMEDIRGVWQASFDEEE